MLIARGHTNHAQHQHAVKGHNTGNLTLLGAHPHDAEDLAGRGHRSLHFLHIARLARSHKHGGVLQGSRRSTGSRVRAGHEVHGNAVSTRLGWPGHGLPPAVAVAASRPPGRTCTAASSLSRPSDLSRNCWSSCRARMRDRQPGVQREQLGACATAAVSAGRRRCLEGPVGGLWPEIALDTACSCTVTAAGRTIKERGRRALANAGCRLPQRACYGKATHSLWHAS